MEVRKEVVIAASPRRVWEALTSQVELEKWCCAEATVNEDEYVLKGREVFTGQLGGKRLSNHHEHELTFTWIIEGQASTVHIKLIPEKEDGFISATYTRVSVVHTNIPVIPIPGSERLTDKWFFECVWILWQRHLKLWMERSEVPIPYDYSSLHKPLIEQSIVVDQEQDKVWEYFTNPDLRYRWLDLDIGEEIERVEGRKLVHSWKYEPYPSYVTWELEPLPDNRTLVTVRHEGLPIDYGFDHNFGWNDYLIALVQATAKPIIRQSIWLDALPNQVWSFLCTEEGMRRWWNSEMVFEPKVGGKVDFQEHGFRLTGHVIELKENQSMTFTWSEEGQHVPFLLEVRLTSEQKGTRVTLTQSGFEKQPADSIDRLFKSYQLGWSDSEELPRLKKAVYAVVHCS